MRVVRGNSKFKKSLLKFFKRLSRGFRTHFFIGISHGNLFLL
ncbi:hypothetical protein LEP1GSC039_2521 [Leptospira santarosai str. 2000027870]|nr:hypothetical protein LEP1GSC039_2521 [Leptospira santarosai str. 2000027870]